jgi:hypothetical protein
MAKHEGAVRVSAHVPPAMKTWLEQRARHNLSSINSELVRALRTAMESEQQRAAG